ncbi:hypothetical protein B0H34DRAFT_692352 [Crassisporium funariophilum]|nr:hypothetical protein B0H34DRAFT_692352 [Crassisporium funariophilum]
MHLYLSCDSPWNTKYCTEEGQAIYKVDGSGNLATYQINVRRIIPATIDPYGDDLDEALRDSFAHLATIDYRTFHSTRIRYADRDLPTGEWFKKKGWGWHGRNRIFEGPDGREYTWKMFSAVCKLFVNDATQTPVACFHRSKGLFNNARPASLEILAEGEHMVDLIVVTFLYMEKMRDQRERSEQMRG